MRPLVIHHKGCMDGAAAALAAYLALGDSADYLAASYGDEPPAAAGRKVYVLDFSYPRAIMERLAAEAASVVLLDHHKTARADLAGFRPPRGDVHFDLDHSGATLAWGYFNAPPGLTPAGAIGPSPALFRYVEDRDLWRWALPLSREVSAALAASGALSDFRALLSIYFGWEESGDAYRDLLATEGAGILRAEKIHVARVVATAEEVTILGRRALAVSCPLLQSEVGEALATESARRGGHAIGVAWHRHGPKGVYRVSLRSRDVEEAAAPDVSTLARTLDPGGGGHARAAGCEVHELPWLVGW